MILLFDAEVYWLVLSPKKNSKAKELLCIKSKVIKQLSSEQAVNANAFYRAFFQAAPLSPGGRTYISGSQSPTGYY